MKKNYTKSILLLVVSFVLSMGTIKLEAQVVSNESFDNTTFLPTGWASVGSTTLWSRRTTGTFPTCTPQSGAGMVRFSSRAQTAGTTQTIALPVIDYSARVSSNAFISFYIYRDNGSVNLDSLAVYINTTASIAGAERFGLVARYSKVAIPDTVAANGWYKYSFNVPAKYTGATNYIMLKGTSQNGNNIYIDDVQWNAYPNLCTGTPTPGNAVATPALICGGSGSTTINLVGQTTGVSGLSYQWKKASAANGPWANTGTNATSLTTGTITATQYYKCVISCSNSSKSDSTQVMSVIVKSTPNPTVTVTPNNANYCAGGKAVKLTAQGAAAYSWTPSTGLNANLGDSVFASPTATTTYTVRGTDTAGCSAQTTVTVSLRQAPFVAINAIDSVTCQGDSILLTAQGAGGGGTTYLWNPTGKTTTAIYASGNTNTKYSLTATNGFGCKATATKNIYFSQPPIANFNVNVVGRTYTFTDNSSNANKLSWDFGDGNSSTAKNPVYTYSFDGTKTITLIAYNAPCAPDTFQQTFNVSTMQSIKNSQGVQLYPNPANTAVNIRLEHAFSGTPLVRLMDLSGKLILPSLQIIDGNTIQLSTEMLQSGIWFFEILDGTSIKKGTFQVIH